MSKKVLITNKTEEKAENIIKSFFLFSKSIYKAWDNLFGKALNLIAAIGPLISTFIYIRKDNESIILLSSFLPLIIMLILATFKVWHDQRKELMIINSEHPEFLLEVDLKEIIFVNFKQEITDQIQAKKLSEPSDKTRNESMFPNHTFYNNSSHRIDELESYLREVEEFEKTCKNIFLLEICLLCDSNDSNIEIDIEFKNTSIAPSSDLSPNFPKYPRQRNPFIPILEMSNNTYLPLREGIYDNVRSEIEKDSILKINVNNIKQGKALKPETELIIFLEDENVQIDVVLNSHKSNGNIEEGLTLSSSNIEGKIEIDKLEEFEYISDYPN